jgi:hypothetical protein
MHFVMIAFLALSVVGLTGCGAKDSDSSAADTAAR